MTYDEFLNSKVELAVESGFEISDDEISPQFLDALKRIECVGFRIDEEI